MDKQTKIFNEHKLRKEIASVWGEHGAHMEVFDSIRNKSRVLELLEAGGHISHDLLEESKIVIESYFPSDPTYPRHSVSEDLIKKLEDANPYHVVYEADNKESSELPYNVWTQCVATLRSLINQQSLNNKEGI